MGRREVTFVRTADLRPHEKIRKAHFDDLFKKITGDGYINDPIIVDKNTMIILDGHHRFNVLRTLGLASSPVYFCRLHR
ncbi:MAG: ParB domain protein nuclease [candidate division TM6 bacterium GW2011_GWE2_41_16]|nr:MAG: ParB domain protein nuclease [candidate division TM6 bacterium GW2011_GWE2_41_16]